MKKDARKTLMIRLKHHFVEDVDFLHPESNIAVEELFAEPVPGEEIQSEAQGQLSSENEEEREEDDGEEILF